MPAYTESTPVLKAADLAEEIQLKVYEIADYATKNFKLEKEIATYVKTEMDSLYGHTWHCIVGKSFGSHVTHEMGFFTYFYIGELAFLLFKSG